MATTKISVQQISDKVFDLIGRNYLFTDKTNVTFDGAESEVERTKLTNSKNVVPTWEEVEKSAIVFVVDGTKNTIMATSKVISKDQANDKIKLAVDGTASGLQDQIDALNNRLTTDENNIATNVSDINSLEGRMDTAEADIDTNTANIATNTSNIATNTTNIATNTSDIATLKTDVSGLDTDLDNLTGRVDQHDTDISNRVTKTEAASFVKDIAYNATTCTFTFTMYDDSTQSVDLPLESTVKGGRYDSATKEMVLILNDASETEIKIPVGDLCDVYTGEDGTIVKVEVDSNNVIKASIKAGTITETQLHQDIKDRFTGWDDSISDLQDQIDAIDTSVANKITGIDCATGTGVTTFDLGRELKANEKVQLWFNGIREMEGDGFTVTRVAGSNTKVTTHFDEPTTANDTVYIEVIK